MDKDRSDLSVSGFRPDNPAVRASVYLYAQLCLTSLAGTLKNLRSVKPADRTPTDRGMIDYYAHAERYMRFVAYHCRPDGPAGEPDPMPLPIMRCDHKGGREYWCEECDPRTPQEKGGD